MLITLSGKKHALNKVYALNKQVFKYVIMAFFSGKISILSLVLTGYMDLCYHAYTLYAFTIARPLNASLL